MSGTTFELAGAGRHAVQGGTLTGGAVSETCPLTNSKRGHPVMQRWVPKLRTMSDTCIRTVVCDTTLNPALTAIKSCSRS